jgi:hypothetical protein
MKEQKKDNPEHQEHSLGMIKNEENGSYYPGCTQCQEPVIVFEKGKINLKFKEKGSPIS